MARKMGTLMFCVRLLQLLVWLIIFAENGWLTVYIVDLRLGYGNNMLAVEFIAGIGMVYTILLIFLLHSRHKTLRIRYLIAFIICDLLLTGLGITTMVILSAAGVPSTCQGLTRQNYNPGDAANNPAPGYSTIRFGSGPDSPGELDKYCVLPRAAWGLCIFQIYVYMTTITLAILRVHLVKHPISDPETKPPPLSPKPSAISLTLLPSSTNRSPAATAAAALPQLTHVQTPRHELPTRDNTTELASPVSELTSPVTVAITNPHDRGFAVLDERFATYRHHHDQHQGVVDADEDESIVMEPSISNGSRGASSRRPARSESVRSGPPPYMPASEEVGDVKGA